MAEELRAVMQEKLGQSTDQGRFRGTLLFIFKCISGFAY
jgi:hypothetical protein